jgi:hypothetical protein
MLAVDTEGRTVKVNPQNIVEQNLVSAIQDNCVKGKITRYPTLQTILGFAKDCSEFGMTGIEQLRAQLAALVPVAPPKTLPTYLRGYTAGGVSEEKFPISLNPAKIVSSSSDFKGGSTSLEPQGRVECSYVLGPVLSEGIWMATISFAGIIGAAVTDSIMMNFGMETTLGNAVPTTTYPLASHREGGEVAISHADSISKVVVVGPSEQLQLLAIMVIYPGASKAAKFEGKTTFSAVQISSTNLVVNGVI